MPLPARPLRNGANFCPPLFEETSESIIAFVKYEYVPSSIRRPFIITALVSDAVEEPEAGDGAPADVKSFQKCRLIMVL